MIQFKICQNGFQVVDEDGKDIKVKKDIYNGFGSYLDAIAKKYPKHDAYIQEHRDSLIEAAAYVTHLVEGIKAGQIPKELEGKFIKL